MARVLDGAPVSFSRIAGTLVADPMPGAFSTASVRLEIGAFTGNVGEGCEAAFDDIHFGGDGTSTIELLSFEVD